MAHYDNYSNRGKPTAFMKMMIRESNRRIHNSLCEKNRNKTEFKVLEIGGGKGEFAEVVSKYKRSKYYAIEPNKELAENLKKYGKVKRATVPPITFRTKFNAIYSSNVIEHVPPDQVNEFISSCRRSLKRNGCLILRFPNYNDFGEMFWDCDYTHVFPTTENRIIQLLRDNNFVINDIEYLRMEMQTFLRFPLFIVNRMLRPLIKLLKSSYKSKLYKLYLTTSEQIIIHARKKNRKK